LLSFGPQNFIPYFPGLLGILLDEWAEIFLFPRSLCSYPVIYTASHLGNLFCHQSLIVANGNFFSEYKSYPWDL